MRAMILAAGRGERMRPLTDTRPKPLLDAGGKPLIVWHILRLARAGLRDITINHAWLGAQIEATLGDGQAFGARLHYSAEAPALETAGGIAHALPFFRGEPFLVLNADIWCDWDPAAALRLNLPAGCDAHLVLVDNPPHHPGGDFTLQPDNHASVADGRSPALTFAGIGVYRPALFSSIDPDHPAALAPLLRGAMARHAVMAEHYRGCWLDIGTPARLRHLDESLRLGRSPC